MPRTLDGRWIQRTDIPPCQAVDSLSAVCGRVPVTEVSFTCPCGHEGSRSSCGPHAETVEEQYCGHCLREYGHSCPVALTVLEGGTS
jgi:hypothetical protein